MDTKDERLQIRLTGELFRKFKAHVALLGKSMSEVTEELLQEWLDTDGIAEIHRVINEHAPETTPAPDSEK